MRRFLLAVALCGIVVLAAWSFSDRMRAWHEYAVLMLIPSATRAYADANKYFDASDPSRYDIAHAEKLYEMALRLDPKLPGVHHQLARIAFLGGRFHTALSFIDAEIALPGGPVSSSSYYVRGLIEGYMERYAEAVKDYETYVKADPTNWAATNDLAWVLLKANQPKDALAAIEKVLPRWPQNPWLLNSKATALFELGHLAEARDAVVAALRAVMHITEANWLQAYPGNDPLIAEQGIEAFQSAVRANMHTILLASSTSGVK